MFSYILDVEQMYNRGVEVLTMTSTPYIMYNKGVEVIVRTSTPLLYIC